MLAKLASSIELIENVKLIIRSFQGFEKGSVEYCITSSGTSSGTASRNVKLVSNVIYH
jgi:hypothetical protein